MAKTTLLVGDIGGTNARFACAKTSSPGFHSAATLKCAHFPSPEAAIRHYLDEQKLSDPAVICLAAAGPVIHGAIKVTNNHWHIEPADLEKEFNTDRVRLVNDFAAVAYSVPYLTGDDYVSIGLPSGDALPDDFSVAIVGPGTGLGAAGLYRRNGALLPVAGEGGHVGFAPESQVQIDILGYLRDRFDRVSVERVLSGTGLENIYFALARMHGEKRKELSAAEIFEQSADDERAAEAVNMFFDILGQVAGDLALTLDARDGVFIAGGITKRYIELLRSSGFRNGFENKGAHRSLMEQIPTFLITHDEPGLLGAAYCALELSS
ncbi:MAG: glucokinase [Pseudomonadota bacterium]